MNKNLLYGIIFFLLSTIITLAVFWLVNKSELEVIKDGKVQVFATPEFEGVRMIYKNDSLQSINVLNLKIRNNSFHAIIGQDFVKDLKLTFNNDAHILAVFPQDDNIDVAVSYGEQIDTISDNIILLNFDLLNRKNEFGLKVLFTGNFDKLDVSGRVVDISEFTYSEEIKNKSIDFPHSQILVLLLILNNGYLVFFMLYFVQKSKFRILTSKFPLTINNMQVFWITMIFSYLNLAYVIYLSFVLDL